MDFKKKYLKYKKKYLDLSIKIDNNKKRSKLKNILNHSQVGSGRMSDDFLERFKNLIICPISYSVMIDPVMTIDGQTYDREYIERWLSSNTTSPISGATLTSTTLTPNIALKNIIEHIIDEGMLDMDVIIEYLRNLGLPSLEQNQKIANILRNKIKNKDLKSFVIPSEYKRVNIKGLNLKYRFSMGKYIKEIVIGLSNGYLLKISQIEGEESIIESLGLGKANYHVRLFSLKDSDNIIIFEEDGMEKIKQILEKYLLDNNFYKIIKDSMLSKVFISPRIKFNPVFYTFMNYSNSIIMKRINNSLAVKQIENKENLFNGISDEIFSITAPTPVLHSAPSETVTELMQPYIRELNDNLGNTRYTLCGILMENIPYIGKEIVSLAGESWGKIVAEEPKVWKLESGRIAKKKTEYKKWHVSDNYVIAFTGPKGIGKSYLTSQCLKPDFIFETDFCSKNTFLGKYTELGNRPVIVVGSKDPTFDLDFIKSQLAIPVYECKIINISERFNIEENLRLEQLRLEREAVVDSEVKVHEESKSLDNDRVYLIGFSTWKEETIAQPDSGDVEGTNDYYTLYLNNGRYYNIEKIFTACSSGWTTATYCNVEEDSYDLTDIPRENILLNPVKFIGLTTEDGDYGIVHTFTFENDQTIEVSENGGDGYYPTGDVDYNIDLPGL